MALSLDCQTSKKVEAGMTSKEGFFMNISSDILFEILSRVPAIDVINCKLVCKRWLKISSTREFAKLHLSRANPGLVAFQREDSKKLFRIFKFDDDNEPNYLYFDPVIEFDLSVFPDIPENCNAFTGLVSSVNGLLCFCHHYGNHEQEILYVCNPVTREYVTLPIVKGFVQSPDTVVYGFGVSSISGQYKAVRISHSLDLDSGFGFRPQNHEFFVYTLGTGSWRSIGGGPLMYDYDANMYCDGLFFNGNLHWVIKDLEGFELISCFDLEKESFQPFPSPLPAEQPTGDFLCLGIVTGCLCLCNNTSGFDIDIWVMKEYGVTNSWMKDYVISKMPYYDKALRYDTVTLLKIFKNGDILLFTSNEYLLTYNNESKTMQMTETIVNIRTQPMLHVSSFLSLKDFEPEKVGMF